MVNSAAWEAPTAEPTETTPETTAESTEEAPPLVVPFIEGEEGFVPEGTPTAAEESAPAIPAEPSQPQQLDAFTRQRIANAERIEAQQREREFNDAVENEVRQFQVDLERRGYGVEEQQWLAQRYQGIITSAQQIRQDIAAERAEFEAKQQVAHNISQQTGVAANLLMNESSPEAMQRVAAQVKENNDLKERVRVLEQGRVPPAHLNGTGTSRVGGQAVTPDNIDVLHTQGRVPDEVYRRFLETGQIR